MTQADLEERQRLLDTGDPYYERLYRRSTVSSAYRHRLAELQRLEEPDSCPESQANRAELEDY